MLSFSALSSSVGIAPLIRRVARRFGQRTRVNAKTTTTTTTTTAETATTPTAPVTTATGFAILRPNGEGLSMNGGTSRVYHCAPALAVQAPVASKSCHNAHQRRESMQPLIPGAYPSLFFVSVSLIFLVIPVDPSHPLPFPGYIIGIAPVLRYEAGLDFDSPPVEPTSIATARRMSTMSAHSELSVSTTASPRLRHVGCHLNC